MATAWLQLDQEVTMCCVAKACSPGMKSARVKLSQSDHKHVREGR
jgi:hypothetical protein